MATLLVVCLSFSIVSPSYALSLKSPTVVAQLTFPGSTNAQPTLTPEQVQASAQILQQILPAVNSFIQPIFNAAQTKQSLPLAPLLAPILSPLAPLLGPLQTVLSPLKTILSPLNVLLKPVLAPLAPVLSPLAPLLSPILPIFQ